MHRSSASRLSASIVSVLAFFLLGSSFALGANKVEKKSAGKYELKTYFPTKMMVSAPLRDHLRRPTAGTPGTIKEGPDKPARLKHAPASVSRAKDPAVRTTVHAPNMPDPIIDFEGQFMTCGCYPPDTNAAVGPDNVWQIVNLQNQIYDKSGNSVAGPFDTNSMWTGFGGPCESTNDGDPVVKYDQLAQRWIVTQFAIEQNPSLQCIAISTSPDPTDTYYLLSYSFGAIFNDYPKWSIMPDAYYLTVRQFGAASGSAVVAFDRNAMIAGDVPTAIFFDINQIYTSDVFLPADLQGTTVPNSGFAGTMIGIGNPDYDGWPSSVLHMIQMTPNFADPPSTVVTNMDLDVDAFSPAFTNVPQGSGHPALEVLAFPMYNPGYRNFGDHDALVFTHDVDAGGGRVGRRWYEVRDPLTSGANIYQQGTFAPDDGLNRWMGSAALDHVGNIAMGYSVGNASTFPSIWYTGRLATDPLGDMTQGENTIIDGSGWQDGSAARWGDYSSMVTDPVDDCTFWYTQEYIQTTGLATWQTRVGSFKFPSCSIGPTGTLQGTVTDGTNPIAGAKVAAGAATTLTNAAGQYNFQLPVGMYDMTATKYGFLPGSANGVSVTDGGTTNQDFTLGQAPSINVNGVVKDALGGWPLYAKVTIKASGAPTFTMYTNPVSGYYSQSLVAGIPYTFIVNAVSPGYQAGGGVVPLGSTRLAPDATVLNWNLTADAQTCSAPGYSLVTSGLVENFDSGSLPEGWTVTNDSSDGGNPWYILTGGDPCGQFAGNLTGGTGPYAVVNSNCDGLVTDATSLITPSVDMTSNPSPSLRFNEDYFNLGDIADVDVSSDGGANWTNVLHQTSDARGPRTIQLDISGVAGGQANVQARWHYYNAFWAWWWQVDNVILGSSTCEAGTGGLVVGNVFNGNNGSGLNGATVSNMTGGGSVKTFATPDDPSAPDGMYILYSDSGSNDLQASLSLYGNDSHTVVVIPGSTIQQNFVLQSGNVSATPTRVDARVDPGGSQNLQMTLSNTGGASAAFQILELNAPASTNHSSGFASDKLRKEALARLNGKAAGLAPTAKGLAPLPNASHSHRPMAVGDVLASYPSGITYGWGVASSGTTFWLSNLGVAGGDDKDYEYDSNTGAQTGNTQPDSFAGGANWAGDGAYDPITGTFWRVLVGGDNCIYEVNPTSGPTGNKICGSPWTGTSQRGLAYDIVNNAFFIGGWNEGIVYHIDASGNVIDSANVGLPISGLAYSAQNGHLLVMSNQAGAPDVTVLDALNNYAVLGTFYIGGSSPVMTPFGQAGMEFDCAGNLWVIDQNTQTIYQVDSGENVACAVDIPWLSETPTSGNLGSAAPGHNGSSSSQPIALDFEGGTLLPGLRQAQLQVKTDTPVAVPAVPVTLTVRFLDVPDSDQFQAYIYGVAGQGVMFGGTPVCSDELHFCPSGVVTRADMAGYLFRAIHGLNTAPPVYQNIFADVHFNDYNAFYIQGIFNDGITAGCGDGTNYCPNSPNTRAQMSVFIWKGQHGSTAPPACTGVFADVPCPSLFADYIEGLYSEGVTAGCGGGNFCPNNNITNGQMAVFLVKGFNIPYLP